MTMHKIKNWEGHNLYVGIDIHKRKWVITVRTEELELKTFATDGKGESLVKALVWDILCS